MKIKRNKGALTSMTKPFASQCYKRGLWRIRRLLQKIKDLFLRGKDISCERLCEHLKNMGIEAEVIPNSYSRKLFGYSFLIRLKGLNIGVMEIRYFTATDQLSPNHYEITFIVEGFERDKWHLKKKLKRLGASIPSSVLTSIKEKKVYVYPDKANEYVRILGKRLPSILQEKKVVEEGGYRVKYKYPMDSKLPSRQTIEAYDKIAWFVRRILETGDSP